MAQNSNMQFKPRLKMSFMPYAMDDHKSMHGRMEKEDRHDVDNRTEFQHDRDRIVHSKAFRRLESKTQVLLSHESDHSRKRLTHSLEVSQISESIAIVLGLNIFLTNAIALGHDVGHTPFGHGGERALDQILRDLGMDGFKHNYQSVLVLNKLEKRYGQDRALNLMWETRDGILKHTKLRNTIDISYYDSQLENHPDFPITLEGQVVRIVDEIAQRTHDTDDGLRTGRIIVSDLLQQPLIREVIAFAGEDLKDVENGFRDHKDIVLSALIINMIKLYVRDLLTNSLSNLTNLGIKEYEDVLEQTSPVICFSQGFAGQDECFKDTFLQPEYYQHYEVNRMDSRAGFFIKQLFRAFQNSPRQLPQDVYREYVDGAHGCLEEQVQKAEGDYSEDLEAFLGGELRCKDHCSYVLQSEIVAPSQISTNSCPLRKHNKKACDGMRIIISHLAGMTDRYAHLEYSRLYFPPEISRL